MIAPAQASLRRAKLRYAPAGGNLWWYATSKNYGGVTMYAITGATGNTGRVIAEKLLAQGQKVRVIGRDAGRLGPLVQKGAEAFVVDVADAASLTKALIGAKAVYAMIPPNNAASDMRAYQERVSDSLVAATKNAGVEYAVTLSSIGADKPDKTGDRKSTRLNSSHLGISYA